MTTTQHTIDCMDSWAKDKGLPTYTELAAALRELHEAEARRKAGLLKTVRDASDARDERIGALIARVPA